MVHDLTMLYLQSKDLKDFTPSQLLDEYRKVYCEIKNHKAKEYPSWKFLIPCR